MTQEQRDRRVALRIARHRSVVLAIAVGWLVNTDASAQSSAELLWQTSEPTGDPTESLVHTLEQGPGTGAYSLVRWDKLVSNARGFPETLEQSAFIADHVIVRVWAGKTQADLAAAAARHGASVRRRLGATQVYLVSFPVAPDASSENAAQQMAQTLLSAESAVVEAATVDELQPVEPEDAQ
jgi:hypothetical protein